MVQVIFLTIKIKYLLTSLNNALVSYTKLNGTGSTIKLEPTYSIFNCLGDKQNTNKMQAT